MIENFNDAISFFAIIILIVYIFYTIIKAIMARRLEQHIRDEQQYYHEWLEDQDEERGIVPTKRR